MAMSRSDSDYIRRQVQERSAIVLDEDKVYLAEARLANLARQAGHASVDSLVAQLRAVPDHALRDRMVQAMATHETSFFRDLQPFEALRKQVLPDLIQRRAAARSLYIWSAACATGQEPYSLAMLLREHFPALVAWRIRLLASDISADVLDRAGQGHFSQIEVNRGLPARLLVKHFDRVGPLWRIKDDIRQMVEFRQINLLDPWPLGAQVDVVLLRNVLIYFDMDTKRSLLGRVRQVLRPDGALFLGGAETTLNIDDAFERCQLDRAVWYRPLRS